MPNDPNGATGEAMFADPIDNALAAWIVENRRSRALDRAFSDAMDLLPAWAAPGPEYLMHDGSKGGGLVGAPEVADIPEPPEHEGARRLIRPRLWKVWKDANCLAFMPPKHGMLFQEKDGSITEIPPSAGQLERRRQARLRVFARLRIIIDRMREQKEERRKVGLDRLAAESDVSTARCNALEDRLKEVASGASLADIAVLVLTEYRYEDDPFHVTLLRRLAPRLSGLLRVVVEDAVRVGDEDRQATLLFGAGDDDLRELVVRSEVERLAA